MLREEPNWKRRPWLARLVRFAVFLIPVLLAALAAISVGRLFPRPETFPGVFLWWVGLLGVVLVVLIMVDRLVVRALPLAALMRLTLVFPDRAPSRVSTLRTSNAVPGLEAQEDAARAAGDLRRAEVAHHVRALAAALGEHDRITRGHAERVGVFTDLLAEEMDLEDDDRNRLRWVALLHDVGKLAVDRAVLNNPDRPTREEWRQLRSHPEEGRKLIEPIREWLGRWAPTIEQHHERYDGSGYPLGLVGDEICLGARIVAVADAYDAITAARSYKRPISAEAARRELAESAGSHFDPHVVRALMSVSLGRLRRAIGPAAWFAQIPIVGGLERFSRQIGIVGATAMLIAVLVAGSVIDLPGAAASSAVTDEGGGSGLIEAGSGGDVITAAGPARGAVSTTSTSAPTTTTVPPVSTTTTSAPIATVPATTTTTSSSTTTTTTAIRPVTTTTVRVTTTTTAPGEPPIAVADTATTAEDTAVDIAVLANDSDADGDALTISGADLESAKGGLITCGTTSCTYLPAPDYCGVDTFDYQVGDPSGRSATAEVVVTVEPVNDAPVAVADEVSAGSGVTVGIDVLSNDSDPEGDQRKVVGVDTSSTAGSLVRIGEGFFLYTSPAGFVGLDTFTYTVGDPHGLTSNATVTITVDP